MIEGAATGKGLNVKGKSARQGVLSGFVPFLQVLKGRSTVLEVLKVLGTRKKVAGTREEGANAMRQQTLGR